MAAHSKQKSCFSCHGVMDPLGLALENFDGVGRWRDRDRLAQTDIDASGELPDGTKLAGPADLRRALMHDPTQFVQTLATKLMIYATGRPMEWHDMPVIRGIVREAGKDDYRFEALVKQIVTSAPFTMSRVPAGTAAPATKQAANIH
jgi:hypothetical protein